MSREPLEQGLGDDRSERGGLNLGETNGDCSDDKRRLGGGAGGAAKALGGGGWEGLIKRTLGNVGVRWRKGGVHKNK